VILRLAQLDDAPALENLIEESVRKLQAADYTPEQLTGALGTVLGLDRQLIRDSTYFAIEVDGSIVACGGWSRRRTLFGADRVPGKDDAWLDPAIDAARIRAFFVHPDWARRGLGTRLLEACEAAARTAGFERLELAATLTGIPLYAARGYSPAERVEVPLANGAVLPVVRMEKTLPPLPQVE
jgi:GNAT superfamily N-acetyltransferase